MRNKEDVAVKCWYKDNNEGALEPNEGNKGAENYYGFDEKDESENEKKE